MSYLTFHLVFMLPPILLLVFAYPSALSDLSEGRARYALPLVCAIAFAYTTPWDNYLVARGIWWYGPERVIATVGYVPVEEYLFFILQPILTGLLFYQVLARPGQQRQSSENRATWIGGGTFIALSLIGWGLIASGWSRGLYLGLILAWASPVFAAMWLYAGRHLWAFRRLILVGVSLPTIYLWIADRVAIQLGIWEISETYTFGIQPFGLPIEEAVFFLVTNLLVVKGTLLFLVPPGENSDTRTDGKARIRA